MIFLDQGCLGQGRGVSRVCAQSTSSLYSVMLGLGIEAVRTTTVEAPTWKRARRRSALEAEHRREREKEIRHRVHY